MNNFSPWDYVHSLPFWGEIADVFSNLGIAFSICLCMPGCCMQKKNKKKNLLVISAFYVFSCFHIIFVNFRYLPGILFL